MRYALVQQHPNLLKATVVKLAPSIEAVLDLTFQWDAVGCPPTIHKLSDMECCDADSILRTVHRQLRRHQCTRLRVPTV